ncbi:MAG TPA: TrmH family RNA methyltransferase [Candidatus Saccharimonadales bacterium]|nr:TrmH family RNA methyltransferase [Candidatus Saccharimonadales bacterium]
MQKFKPYKKGSEYSFTSGIFPTIELLTRQPGAALQVYLAPNSDHSQGVRKIRELCAQRGIPLEVNDKAINRLAPSSHSFALGVFKKYATPLATDAPHVVLVNPDDAGNMGTILRTMLGFGHRDLAVIRPAVDALDPKTVRASMGSVFSQRIEYFDSIDDYIARFSHHLYPFLLEGSSPLRQVSFAKPYSLVFGNEGAGLPAVYQQMGTPVRIEQDDAVDSLNLAVATSVALYHAYISNK